MIYIETNSVDPYYNFALEYYLMTEKLLGTDNILLFWQTAPTLMVGRYQNIPNEMDMGYIREKKYNVVRRLSGGGTIYTDLGGWQYSVITRNKKSEIDFLTFTKPVVEALQSLGVKAYFNDRNDLLIDGKKISGNAQYNLNGYTLHHGSLLFNTDLGEMQRCLTVSIDKIVSKGIGSVRERVTNIKNYLNEDIGEEEFKALMLEFLMGQDSEQYVLSDGDIQRIEKIADEKFRNWDWTIAEEPKFEIQCKKRFEGGSFDIRISVDRGLVNGCQIYGDFFSSGDINEKVKSLIGCRYEIIELKKRLKDLNLEKILYKISNEDILSCII